MTSKNLQLLSYFAKKHPGASVTVLVKLCYLADLISIKKSGKKISTFDYYRYFYGPFDKKIYSELESLVSAGILLPKSEYISPSAETIVYTFNDEKELVTSEIQQSELAVIDELLDSVRGYGAKTLTEICYKTKPMTAIGAILGGTENLNKKLDLNLVIE